MDDTIKPKRDNHKTGFAKHNKSGKKRINREPTKLEQAFVIDNLCNPQSENYLDPIKSAFAAGFKGIERHTSAKVGSILIRPAVIKLVTNATNPTVAILDTMTRLKYEQELSLFLQNCKDADDRTNWKGALELYGKFAQYLTERHLVTVESSRQLSDSYLKELRELSKLSMSGSVIDAELSDQSGVTRLLPAQSGVVSSPCDIQDVVDDAAITDHNCDDIDKCSNDKDLQNQ